MRRTLIAIATAGALASGAAIAGSTTVQLNQEPGRGAFVPAQYSPDRWDDRSASINDREARIRARIDRGINDGRITKSEARRLYRQLASIEAKEHSYKSDGRLSYREEAQLKHDLDSLAQNVQVQLRDEDRSYSYNNPYHR